MPAGLTECKPVGGSPPAERIGAMKRTDTIIIGGGQAGLAMSRCLTDEGIDHVVLERGRVAERWRSERWDSLRLLSPKWHTRLPGLPLSRARISDGFMTMPELISYFERYARSFSAPVQDETTVLGVERADGGYLVRTDQGDWEAPNVVLATGHCDVPFVPKAAAGSVAGRAPSRAVALQEPPTSYPIGGVLVVGASASGIQLAQEIHRSGRPVTLAVGRHTRIPRRYRGRDIAWWMEASGLLAERAERSFSLEIGAAPALAATGGHAGPPEHRLGGAAGRGGAARGAARVRRRQARRAPRRPPAQLGLRPRASST